MSSVPSPEPLPCEPATPAQPRPIPDAPAEARSPDAALPGAGVPDAFGPLWTPHRLADIQGGGKPPARATRGLPVLHRADADGRGGPIVARGELVYAVMNLYPYNSGHVLICPYPHLAPPPI